ncbi:MAG: TraR/DksA family transcriptional regulator [Actinomycetota bacterium]
MDQEIQTIRRRLEDEKSTLERQLTEHGADTTGGVEVGLDEGFADSAQVTTERSELLGLVEQLRDTLELVNAALQRMDQGTYGKCQQCGREIPAERLEAVPTTSLCVDCKQTAGR